ncbi:hypothetical protein [Vibrio jasicida]|uniref:hypothetical protein n=1 Tax=Vibrio jasicida TaxID=766224 RepID=UPI000CE41452|nr:hypothetical protein [Vibrio jasicida]
MNSTEVQLRAILRYIDAHLELNGWINSPQIMEVFRIQRQKASQAFGTYKDLQPTNMHFDSSKKRYVILTTFKRAVLKKEDSALGYLDSIDMVFGE